MVAYLDSSVLLRHILLGDEGIRQVFECDTIISSELLEIECYRVFHRYRLQGDLDDSGLLEARERLTLVVSGVSLLMLSPAVKKRSSEAFPVVIRTFDALHLSSALAYCDAMPMETLLMFSYDDQLNRCTRAVGIKTPFSVDV
jgi:hypothetical protein